MGRNVLELFHRTRDWAQGWKTMNVMKCVHTLRISLAAIGNND